MRILVYFFFTLITVRTAKQALHLVIWYLCLSKQGRIIRLEGRGAFPQPIWWPTGDFVNAVALPLAGHCVIS